MTSICFMTPPPVLRPATSPAHVLTVVHIYLLYSKIRVRSQSHVNATTRTARNVTVTTTEGGMLSATLEAGLSDYAIGAKIYALRLKKKMGLVELGQHSGLSPRASGWEGHVLSLRVTGLPGDRADVQLVLRRVLARGAACLPAETLIGIDRSWQLPGTTEPAAAPLSMRLWSPQTLFARFRPRTAFCDTPSIGGSRRSLPWRTERER